MPTRESLQAILVKTRRRLSILEEKEAGFGRLNAPADLLIDLEDTRIEVTQLEEQLTKLSATPTVEALLSDTSDVEGKLKQATLLRLEAEFMKSEKPKSQEYKKPLKEAYALLQKAKSIEPTNTAVLLETAEVLTILTPDDPTDERKLLLQVKALLGQPRTEEESFQLARAMYHLGAGSDPVQVDLIDEAFATFERLSRWEWVTKCQQIIATLPQDEEEAEEEGQVEISFDDLVGNWQLHEPDTVTYLELYDDGTCAGATDDGQGGVVEFQGKWDFEPETVRILFEFKIPRGKPIRTWAEIHQLHDDGLSGVNEAGQEFQLIPAPAEEEK